MGKRDWSGVSSGPSSDAQQMCSTLACKRRSRRDLRTIPVPPQSASRSVSPSITVSLDRLLDALEFDPDWTPSADIIQDFGDWEEEHEPEEEESPLAAIQGEVDPECIECCAVSESLREPSEAPEEPDELLSEDSPGGEKRKKIVLGPDGEPDIISDIESEDDFEYSEKITANVSPPVVVPKKELIYYVNVIGEDGMLEIDRIDDKHPLPNCRMRDMNAESFSNFYPPFYVQGVCSEILDPDIPAPRWLGEEFDKTEEELEQEKKERHKLKEMEIEYEF